jgi:hypothetical protein
VEIPQRGREAFQVLAGAARADVRVVGDHRRPVEHGRDTPDEDVLDTVPLEHGEDALRIDTSMTQTRRPLRIIDVVTSSADIGGERNMSTVRRAIRSSGS